MAEGLAEDLPRRPGQRGHRATLRPAGVGGPDAGVGPGDVPGNARAQRLSILSPSRRCLNFGRSGCPPGTTPSSAAAPSRYEVSYGGPATWTWWHAGPRGSEQKGWVQCARLQKEIRWFGSKGARSRSSAIAWAGCRRADWWRRDYRRSTVCALGGRADNAPGKIWASTSVLPVGVQTRAALAA